MEDSILNGTKKALGLDSEYHEFDPDIIMHINSALVTIHDLGIGPVEGFMIEDEYTTWNALLHGDPRFNSVKTLVYSMVRIVFDPPATSFVLDAFKANIAELTWRISMQRENILKGDKTSTTVIPAPSSGNPDGTLDGGNPSGVLEPDTRVYDGGSP